MLNDLTLPPRLVIRALDDLHALAQTARTLPEVERRLTDRIEALEATGQQIHASGLRIEEILEAAMPILHGLDERGQMLLTAADSLEERLQAVVDALPTIAAFEVSVKTLAQTVEPLQGIADRLGRIADRLPGARRAS